jgi:exodeoxyribonuclease VII large subunit
MIGREVGIAKRRRPTFPMPSVPLRPPVQTGFDFETPGEVVAASATRPLPTRELTVTGLHTELKRALNTLGEVRVTGEVHGVKQYPNGRYFTLKDRAAQVSVRVPTSREKWCRSVQGESVIVTGRMETFSRNGSLSLTASTVEPVGEGAVAAMIAQARERLRADGLLDRVPRGLPLLPRAVGLVCGSDAAVLHDITSVIDRRYAGFPLVVVEVSQSTPESIMEGLAEVTRRPGVDVVILARGGGDSTQLLPYSNEHLCRAVAECRIPVVSAIGHEIDHPLCDEVADYRAATPSVAAAMVIPDRSALTSRLDEASEKSWNGYLRVFERARSRSEFIGLGLENGPARALARARSDLNVIRWDGSLLNRIQLAQHTLNSVRFHESVRLRHTDARLLSATLGRRVSSPPSVGPERARLEAVRAQIESLSPSAILNRGFAVVTDIAGNVVRDVDAVQPGDRLTVRVAMGELQVAVVSRSVTS